MLNLEKYICEHDQYCIVKKTLNKKHCSLDYTNKCQTWKFYTKYGESWNDLGVGS
ncbi:hypothetical protein LCGC14_1762070 [marine sediment metagenome]|uniref:Uncharacterized protein n=1 Tax=marine sediment metagenome TaxID=412755 RepID=A0A0F9H0T4_9ZZZZ